MKKTSQNPVKTGKSVPMTITGGAVFIRWFVLVAILIASTKLILDAFKVL